MRWNENGFYAQQKRSSATVRFRFRQEGAAAPSVSYAQSDYLMHFGIPGMKWGIRRYQNEDGSYTEEGKQRYGRDGESSSWKKSDAKSLSDDELRRRNTRLQSEQQYRSLTTTDKERDRAQTVRDFKKGLLKAALITPVLGIAAYMSTKAIKNNGIKAIDMIDKFAKRKTASFKAANILKSALKNSNVPHQGQYNPLKDYALKKHPEWNGLDLLKRVGQ